MHRFLIKWNTKYWVVWFIVSFLNIFCFFTINIIFFLSKHYFTIIFKFCFLFIGLISFELLYNWNDPTKSQDIILLFMTFEMTSQMALGSKIFTALRIKTLKRLFSCMNSHVCCEISLFPKRFATTLVKTNVRFNVILYWLSLNLLHVLKNELIIFTMLQSIYHNLDADNYIWSIGYECFGVLSNANKQNTPSHNLQLDT